MRKFLSDAGWIVGLLGAIWALVIHFTACQESQAVKSAVDDAERVICLAEWAKITQTSSSCWEAFQRLDAFLNVDPTCETDLGDGGAPLIFVCAEPDR